MQTLAQQASSMGVTPTPAMRGSISFYDVVASDSLSSYRMAKQVQIATDKQSVSIAGENGVLPGSGITIAVNLQDVLLSTHESGLAFKLTCTNGGYVKNASKLFECLSFQVGALDQQSQNDKFYRAQVLNTSHPEELKQYATGEVATYKIDRASNLAGQQLNIAAGANPADVGDFSSIHEYVSSLYANWKRHVVGAPANAGAAHEVNCFVSFRSLCTQMRDLPALFLGLGQRLVMNLRLVPSGEALMHASAIDGGGAPEYTISQAHGVYVHSALDAPRRDMILRSNVSPLPIIKNVSFQQVAQQTIALQIPISRGQFVRRLLISLHHQTQSIQAAANTNALANAQYFAAATGKAKGGPLNYQPKFGLEWLQLQIGSQTYTYRQQQLKFLQVLASGQPTPFDDIGMINHNYCLEIDLSRFGIDFADALGSLGQEQSQVTVNFQFSDDPVMPGQVAGVNGLVQNLANFFCIVNAECISFAQCQSGIYSMI